jgi:hypothetical protein
METNTDSQDGSPTTVDLSVGLEFPGAARCPTEGGQGGAPTHEGLATMASPLEPLIAKLADRDGARTEADVQADVRQLLLEGQFNLGEKVLLERQVGDRRRIDVEVGCTVIEVKKDLRVGNVRT